MKVLWELNNEFAITELQNMPAHADVVGEVVEFQHNIRIAPIVRWQFGDDFAYHKQVDARELIDDILFISSLNDNSSRSEPSPVVRGGLAGLGWRV